MILLSSTLSIKLYLSLRSKLSLSVSLARSSCCFIVFFAATINNFFNRRMHIEGYRENSTVTREVNGNWGDVSTITTERSQEVQSDRERDNEGIVASHLAAEIGQAKNSVTRNENENVVSKVLQDLPQASNGNPMQEMFQSCSSSQGLEDYNELYRQYYELEEQRQKILYKLQQFGRLNHSDPYENSQSCLQWGYQQSVGQDSHQNILVPCCSYACQCSIVPCSSVPSCCLVGACPGALCTDPTVSMGIGKQCASSDVDIVNTAMGATERVISSLKEKASDVKEKNAHNSAVEQHASSETDLTVVLNAWYSAGFYTGKYLTEQSLAKKRHG
ncbi:hypothetical protein Ancab_015775 [Ancistrocladus abbreviatus]